MFFTIKISENKSLLSVKNKEEFKIWLDEWQRKTHQTYRVKNTRPSTGNKVVYKARYRCHRNTYPSSHGVKQPTGKHTGCGASMIVTIKPTNAKQSAKNRLLNQDVLTKFPTIVELTGEHNHKIDAEEAVEYRDPLPEITDKFLAHFDVESVEEESDVPNNTPKTSWLESEERKIWLEIEKKISHCYENNRQEFSKAISVLHKRLMNTKTDSEVLSLFHIFGKVNQSKRTTKIKIKPTVVSHRKTSISGRNVQASRCSPRKLHLQEHTYSNSKEYPKRKKPPISLISAC